MFHYYYYYPIYVYVYHITWNLRNQYLVKTSSFPRHVI